MKPEWYKNRNVWYGLLLVVVGLVGGNVDRVDEFFPDLTTDNVALEQRVYDLEVRVESLEKVGQTTNLNLDKILDLVKRLNIEEKQDDL